MSYLESHQLHHLRSIHKNDVRADALHGEMLFGLLALSLPFHFYRTVSQGCAGISDTLFNDQILSPPCAPPIAPPIITNSSSLFGDDGFGLLLLGNASIGDTFRCKFSPSIGSSPSLKKPSLNN
jgi:hypothetical protein